MRIATLFSGIGSPEQGAARVYPSHEIVFACEFDKYARQSYEANYSIAPEHFHKDVNDLDGTQYRGKVDILIGGSPCQSFSLAGLRKGTDDHRGELIYQYIRIVDECRPEVIVYENVKGIMSIDNGNTIKDFVQALRDIGYHCHYDVVNTKDYGVPQNRERLFLVGFLDADAYHNFEFAPKVKLEKRLKDMLEENVDEKYYLSDKMIKNFKRMEADPSSKMTIQAFHDANDICATLTAQYAKSRITDPYVKMVGNTNPSGNGMNGCVYNDDGISPTLTTNKGEGIKVLSATTGDRPGDSYIKVIGKLDIKGTDQIKRVYGTDGIAATLTTMQGGNQEPKIQVAQTLDTACNQAVVEPTVFENRTEGMRFFKDECCGALRTKDACGYKCVIEPKIITQGYLQTKFKQRGQVFSTQGISPTLDTCTGGGRETKITCDHKIRKLTPRECLRLQDFPDTFKIAVSNSQAYKQAGNSMSVNILEMIFNQIEKAKSGETSGLFQFIA